MNARLDGQDEVHGKPTLVSDLVLEKERWKLERIRFHVYIVSYFVLRMILFF